MKLPLRAYWDLLAQYIRQQSGRFSIMAALLLGGIALQVINPQIMRGFIDSALSGGELQSLVISALLFLGIAIFQQVIAVNVVYLSETVAWKATNALRADLARHCIHLDMGFHNQHTPGELIERIDGDVAELAMFFSQFVVTLASNLLLVLGILIALFVVDWRTGLTFTLFASAALWVLNRLRDIAITDQKARRQAEADLFGFIEEQLSSTEDIRSSGAVSFSLRELFRFQAAIFHHDRRAQRRGWLIELAMGVAMMLGTFLAVLSGYLLFNEGAITIGMVYLFIHYSELLQTPIWTLIREVQSFQTIGACVERLTELKKIQPNIMDGEGATFPGGPLTLEFNQVSFSYNSGEPVLQNLSFCLQSGAALGLLGRTGSGKTTLARLVFRLYDACEGHISLSGVDIRRAGLSELHRRVALVTQEVQLFQGSLRDNLTFYNKRISDDQILSAIDQLGLREWFYSLSGGLDTPIEGGGRSLSAGEAQLLAFTRVFLRDPGLVILDEASARLDPITEQHLERAIGRLLQNRTAIIIAHRLETVQRADQVMILENGQIIEHGERQRLAADAASHFYRLLQTGIEEALA